MRAVPHALNITARQPTNPLREHVMASTTFNSASDVQTDSATATLAQNWWLFTLRGVFAIIFGCLALAFPGPTMLSLVLLFSAYMLSTESPRSSPPCGDASKGRWGFLILQACSIRRGICAFLRAYSSLPSCCSLLPAIVTGALMTAAAFRLNIEHGRSWLVLAGCCRLRMARC